MSTPGATRRGRPLGETGGQPVPVRRRSWSPLEERRPSTRPGSVCSIDSRSCGTVRQLYCRSVKAVLSSTTTKPVWDFRHLRHPPGTALCSARHRFSAVREKLLFYVLLRHYACRYVCYWLCVISCAVSIEHNIWDFWETVIWSALSNFSFKRCLI